MVRFRFGLLAILSCFATIPAQALTLAQVRTEVRRAIRDNPADSSRYRYSDAVLLDFINEAQREVVNMTWLAEKTTTYVLSARTSYYVLPDDYLAVTQAYFRYPGGDTIELDELSQKGLYDTMPGWESESGSPVNYWVSNATNPSVSNPTPMRISYIPVPTTQSTGTVTLWYLQQVADLANDTDVPFDGRRTVYPYHMGIVYHVVTRIKLIEGKADEAQLYQVMFTNSVGISNDRMGRRPNYTPSMMGGKR
jgi:hypothetical protein